MPSDIPAQDAQFHLDQATKALAQNASQEALKAARTSLARQPQAIRALHVFGVAACLEGQARQALPILRLALSARPDDPAMLAAVSVACREAGDPGSACDYARKAVALAPDRPQVLRALAEAQRAARHWTDAALTYEGFIKTGRATAKDHRGHGACLMHLGRGAEALRTFEKVVAQAPTDLDTLSLYANALSEQGRLRDAIKVLKWALKIDPKRAETAGRLGALYYKGSNTQKSLSALRHGLRHHPKDAGLLVNIGLSLAAIGKAGAAVTAFFRSLETRASPIAHSNAVFYAQYTNDHTSAGILELHKTWARRHAAALTPERPTWTVAADPDRRLRIAYVSPDLRMHSCAYFLLGLMEHHDHAAFEVHAYMTNKERDRISERLRALVDVWHDADDLSQKALATTVSQDNIDILIDLAGHTAKNRLMTFAFKPAPVQVTWLGYPTTTGLDTVDWRISDPWLTPADSQEGFTERVYRLPRVSHAFHTGVNHFDLPPVTESPVVRNGHLTFGSFNNLAKVSEPCLAYWAAILKAIPDARLRIKSGRIASREAEAHLTQGFAAAGGDATRLEICGGTQRKEDHLAQIGDVDIALDTYPYGGMTTTCETLLMGVPVLSLVGERTASRYGLSVLTAVGLPELAAHSVEEVTAAAVALNEDRDRLRTLRAGLRDRVLASPLCDHAGFARAMEAAYRDMWTQWCASQTPTPR